MAGDWIKMRTDLDTDPAVMHIAHATSLDADGVIAKLWRVWSWAGCHTTTGKMPLAGLSMVDQVAKHTGFAKAMAEAGWLLVAETGLGITFPKWSNHNSKGAKQRAQSAQRMANKRAKMLRGERNASVTREEKRREEKRDEEPPYPPSLQSPEFAAAFSDFQVHRREIGKPLKATARKLAIAKCLELGESRAIAAIRHSIASGWQGIFEDKYGSQSNGTDTTNRAFALADAAVATALARQGAKR